MFETIASTLDWFGVVVFTVTGCLVASRKQMDIVGFALMGTVTGIGGGTLRDTLLNLPVFWIEEPSYLLTCGVTSVVIFFTAHIPQSRYRTLLWLDAVGLALFAVTGAGRAMDAGVGAAVVVAMGVVTATFGGIIRDLLGGESPVILTREVYITAALAAAAAFIGLIGLGAVREFATAVGFVVGLLVRAAALHFHWSLPRYKPRPGVDTA
ncbi:trimeric intracellular cation channel family protein [Sphingomonas sp. S1-29]|uniref:trimeric intracellular cation channel family protein n=1 Tax=Sphingomonas sp. S1-29 TaxID=2991074 RepID=UPI00223F2DA8|nr:trimeric intracellular cation channel family protein [Sphingomonas sp. S1-29]UZK71096.1 trimeric intracellular cation channel family protein [Sphingomonas sp. S1-29]